MSGFIFGVVVGVVINLITALFSRAKALKFLPWLLFYVLAHGTAVALSSDTIWRVTMSLARRYASHAWISYLVVMAVSAVLGGVYWKIARVAIYRLEDHTSEPKSQDVVRTDKTLDVAKGSPKEGSPKDKSVLSDEKKSSVPTKVRVIFKDSPLLTAVRRNRIATNIDGFRDYLIEIGFEIPVDVPPIETVPGTANVSGSVDGERYYTSLEISEDRIDDPMMAIAVYATFVFPALFNTNDTSKPDHAFRGLASQVFADYFNFSYSDRTWTLNGRRLPLRRSSWQSALWDIRAECGKAFADESLFYMFTQIDRFSSDPRFFRNPKEGFTISTEEFNDYFLTGFLAGEQVKDNRFHNLAAINRILKEHGLTRR